MSDRSRLRLTILSVLVLSLLGSLAGRLWYLQVMAGDHYREVAVSNRIREVVTPTTRGRLLDAQGRALVRNRTALVVTVNGKELERQPDRGAATLQRLAGLIGMPLPELTARIRPCGRDVPLPCWNGSPYQPVPVAEDVPFSMAMHVQEHREDFAGVEAGVQAVRAYPEGTRAAHVLGFVSPVTQEELDRPDGRGLRQTDQVGRSGLEQSYDAELRGASGAQRVAVNSAGRVTGVVDTVEPVPGNDVVLSLDSAVQRVTEDALVNAVRLARRSRDKERRRFAAPAAAAVVLEARTGNVVAMASYPTYRPEVFVGGVSTADYRALTSPDSGLPLISRATQGLFAPGSTFKIVPTASAVESGQVSLGSTVDCPGSLQVGTRLFRNFESVPLGRISLRTSLVKSCDTVYYRFGYNDWLRDERLLDDKRPPAEPMQQMARRFGLGAPTGVDLPTESAGNIVDRAFKQQRWAANKAQYCRDAQRGYPDEPDPVRRVFLTRLASENCTDGFRYNPGDAVNFSIGQGETVVTPLQLAVSYAALANGGTIYAPRLARAIMGPDGKVVRTIKPQVRGRLGVRQDVLAYIRSSLTGVPSEGTAQGAFGPQPDGRPAFPLDRLEVAGKTGTAEVTGKQDTSWFASFAPANNPKYVVVAMVEQAGTGGSIAAPAVREIYEGIYGIGRPAALPGGQTPRELPRIAPDGTVRGPAYQPAGPASLPLLPSRGWPQESLPPESRRGARR